MQYLPCRASGRPLSTAITANTSSLIPSRSSHLLTNTSPVSLSTQKWPEWAWAMKYCRVLLSSWSLSVACTVPIGVRGGLASFT